MLYLGMGMLQRTRGAAFGDRVAVGDWRHYIWGQGTRDAPFGDGDTAGDQGCCIWGQVRCRGPGMLYYGTGMLHLSTRDAVGDQGCCILLPGILQGTRGAVFGDGDAVFRDRDAVVDQGCCRGPETPHLGMGMLYLGTRDTAFGDRAS